MKIPRFEDDRSEISCPSCGGNYLHHYKVESYFRDKEDANQGLLVTAIRGEPTTMADHGAEGLVDACASMLDNPSDRRDGVRIWLYCEGCDARSELALTQHKGQTFVTWDRAR